MEIAIPSADDPKDWNETKRLVRLHGVQRAKLIRRRLDDLHAVASLEVMRNLPGRCHELKANRAGQLSIDLDGPYRLIFKPSETPPPKRATGGLDWTEVVAITLVEVANTHE
jgi:proteic killer suppression protein